ncbi:hypothetical protein [Streptomyces sp. NPDC048385]|uniref:hypothetical protein n=1 Tax=unclassified Streptomyces TaxID=2593676 RepID=UPI0034146775
MTMPSLSGASTAGRVYVVDKAHIWTEVGHTVGVDFGVQPLTHAAVARPCQQEKRSITVDVPLSDSLRAFFEPFLLAADVWQEKRVARIAAELGLHPRVARLQFDGVQRVLEAAGIGDGYGRLTIPQPVRPPVKLPRAPRLITVYSVFDWASPQPDGPRPLTMRSLPRPRR